MAMTTVMQLHSASDGKPSEFSYRGMHRYVITQQTFREQLLFGERATVGPVLDVLRESAASAHFEVVAYCFLPSSLVMLTRGKDDQADLKEFVSLFRTASSAATEPALGHALWKRTYLERVVRRAEDTLVVAKEVLLLPVTNGLVQDPESYEFIGSFSLDVSELIGKQRERPAERLQLTRKGPGSWAPRTDRPRPAWQTGGKAPRGQRPGFGPAGKGRGQQPPPPRPFGEAKKRSGQPDNSGSAFGTRSGPPGQTGRPFGQGPRRFGGKPPRRFGQGWKQGGSAGQGGYGQGGGRQPRRPAQGGRPFGGTSQRFGSSSQQGRPFGQGWKRPGTGNQGGRPFGQGGRPPGQPPKFGRPAGHGGKRSGPSPQFGRPFGFGPKRSGPPRGQGRPFGHGGRKRSGPPRRPGRPGGRPPG